MGVLRVKIVEGGILGVFTSDENRSRNATVRVFTDGQTDANRFYNLSHAVCYSYGADNNVTGVCQSVQTIEQMEPVKFEPRYVRTC